VGLKLKGAHHFLACADDVNLRGYNIENVNKNTKTVSGAGREVGTEITADISRNMLLFRHQNTEQSHHIKRTNRTFENVAQLKHL
jgi:hypothetical protein